MKTPLKLSLCILFTLFLLGVGQAQAPAQLIKTNPIGLAFGNFNAFYEKALNESSSFVVGGRVIFKLLGTDVSGFGFNGEYRYYITNKTRPAPSGFYIGPSVSFNNFTDKSAASNPKISTFGIGGIIGYQWIWGSGVVLDIGIGPQYSVIVAEGDGSTEDFSGFLPRVVLAVGYAF